MIVAIHIPTSALLNNPIFYNDETKLFNLNETNMTLYNNEGFMITNIMNIPIITAQTESQLSSLYDLYLGFDGNDFTNNYITIKRNYETNTLQKKQGIGSAKFISDNNSIILFPTKNSVLKNNVSSFHNFTITFSLYPYRIGEENQNIVEYKGFYNDTFIGSQEYGFNITIEGGIINYHFNNFFIDTNGKYYSFTLKEKKPLINSKWEQHAIIVDSAMNTIKIYRNNIEQDVILVRQSQSETSQRLTPAPILSSSEHVPLTIGKNGVFSLDEFIIYKDAITNFMNYIPNKMNFFETDVFNISKNISALHEMNVEASSTNFHYKLAYRINNKYFLPSTSSTNLPWVYINPNKKIFPPSQSMGKYLQWRVEYYTAPIVTEEKFYIQNIFAKFKETSNPGIILINHILPKDTSIEISWQTLPNSMISSYEIYYGNQPKTYFGTATVSPNSPISININKTSISQSVSYLLEGLDNEKPYYISIRAKDIYGQYGPFSPEIISRPSSINVDFGDSIDR